MRIFFSQSVLRLNLLLLCSLLIYLISSAVNILFKSGINSFRFPHLAYVAITYTITYNYIQLYVVYLIRNYVFNYVFYYFGFFYYRKGYLTEFNGRTGKEGTVGVKRRRHANISMKCETSLFIKTRLHIPAHF